MINEHCCYVYYDAYIDKDRTKIMNMFHWCDENVGKENFDWVNIISIGPTSYSYTFKFNTLENKILFQLTWNLIDSNNYYA
jgi:hypothetical protein